MNKFECAEINLKTGINLFFTKNFISSITLVGASHEIFDTLLNKKSIENSTEFLSSFTGDSLKNINDTLNELKNWTKHANRDHKSQFEPIEDHCIILIALTIPAYLKLGEKENIETSKFKVFFEEWVKKKLE
jgi:hypothetical protein